MVKWYYEFVLTVLEDGVEASRCGVICANSYREAVADLESFYGDQIIRIDSLTCAVDGLYEINGEGTDFHLEMEK